MSRSVLASSLPGLDLDHLRSYLESAVVGPVLGPISGQVIAGGRSNLTYRLTDGTSQWVLRRPPLGNVLSNAHDMSREFKILTALEGTSVPVPTPIHLCQDSRVLGAPFYLMNLVAGTSLRLSSELEARGPARTRAISEQLVDTLATLHSVDPQRVGLGDFARQEAFTERQVRRWKNQLDASRSRDLDGIDELHRLLVSRKITAVGTPAIVHGDYRLDNVLVDDADSVTAVLDWEMATVGDALSDLALMIAYSGMPAGVSVVSTVAHAPGYLNTDEIIQRYVVQSGRDTADLGYYVGLAHFKLAVVLEGIHARYLGGNTVGDGFELIGDLVPVMVEAGLQAMRAA
jgi:aminoglycoside phosphotransferase (APT) family kinase protein